MRQTMNRIFPATLALVVAASPARSQQQPDPASVPIVLTVPGMDKVRVQRDVVFPSTAPNALRFDLYSPANGPKSGGLPAVVFISGTEDARSWKWYQSYGKVAAAMGLAGIVPEKRYPRGFDGITQGHADTDAILNYLRQNGSRHGIDPSRICVWAFSGGGRLMSVAFAKEHADIRCVVGFYPLGDATNEFAVVADSARRMTLLSKYSPSHVFRSRAPDAPPVFIARAGRDSDVINGSIDRFMAAAVAANAEVTFVNYPDGLHGFDAYNDTPESRRIIQEAFAFIRRKTSRQLAPR